MEVTIKSAIACNLDTNILLAALPLFEAAEVEAMEWSFDALYKHRHIPDWFLELLTAFGQENSLIGHGVFFSLFSGKWSAEQAQWLQHLKKVCAHFQFDHITEHFGFMTGENFHAGAPISIPFTPKTLALGQDRLQRIYEICQCPVGLENLAFAYSLEEVKAHGEFLEQLVSPINGFIILDLHNIYCQLQNFSIAFSELLACYPLDRVREIHISGGSWEASSARPNQPIRRDTHNDAVPDEVFGLLEKTIDQCPNLRYVVLEQLGTGLHTATERATFAHDFKRMKQVVLAQHNVEQRGQAPQQFLPNKSIVPGTPLEDPVLHAQQLQLSNILENAPDYRTAQTLLAASDLADTAWKVEQWEPAMLETALKIAQKWKDGFG